MAPESLIYKNILNHMDGGVMTLGGDGRVMTYNPAASRLLGLPGDQVVGRLFAEVFLDIESMDDFNQAIMDAVYDGKVNHRQVIEIRRGDTIQSLALTTSYLQSTRDDESRIAGVIVIFSDVTELRELRETELRLAESVQKQHNELQNAYREIEESNRALASSMKRGRMATVFIIGMFLAVGLYAWDADFLSALTWPSVRSPASEAPAPADLGVVVVRPQRMSSTISLSGQLAPRREVSVTSPVSGKVTEVRFRYGEHVTRGQPLVELDTTQVQRDHREARAAYIKASGRLDDLEDWENSIEMVRARRVLTRARLALETQKDRLDETTFLLQQGIIPASEHESAQRQYHSRQIDHESAQQDLGVVLAKGSADERRVARLEYENARVRLQGLEDALRQAAVAAPVTGVILLPSGEGGRGSDSGSELLVSGRSVAQGERLLSIGDIDGLSVTGQVDEVDIAKIRLGQKVRVSGDAFHDLDLHGTVAYVSPQAVLSRSSRTPPSFEITVALEDLTDAQRRRLRLGMSAVLEVVVYDKPDALLVPIGAVQIRGDEAWLRVRDRSTGEVRRVRVEAGPTTLDAVEIVRGVEAGDEVVLSGSRG